MKKLLFIPLLFIAVLAQSQNLEYYLLKEYKVSETYQSDLLEDYFADYLPALKKSGIEAVGVFKNIQLEGINNQVYNGSYYVLIPFNDLAQIEAIESDLSSDSEYQSAAADYIKASYERAPYARMETTLLRAFENHPNFKIPDLSAPKEQRIYEMRSYEASNETYFKNKVKMFNDGDEIGLFTKLNFNASFYGEVLVGSKMPNLIYMTSFNNREERDLKWKEFFADPQWKELAADKQYSNNVSKADLIFLQPLPFSDF